MRKRTTTQDSSRDAACAAFVEVYTFVYPLVTFPPSSDDPFSHYLAFSSPASPLHRNATGSSTSGRGRMGQDRKVEAAQTYGRRFCSDAGTMSWEAWRGAVLLLSLWAVVGDAVSVETIRPSCRR